MHACMRALSLSLSLDYRLVYLTQRPNPAGRPPSTHTGEDEYGIEGGIEPRFHRNGDCRNAYKNYFCWANFPRCDDYEQSLMTCRSSCENFFRVCGYEKDLWRCGESKYFNGYAPEVSKQNGEVQCCLCSRMLEN